MKRCMCGRTGIGPRAFTLVELLVVMAILLIVMLLVLPAILKSIEAADRNRCAVNQAKLALGMVSYDARNGFFPGIRNTLMIKSPDGTGSPRLSAVPTPGVDAIEPGRFSMPASTTNWFVMILPYIGFAPTYDLVVDGRVWIGNTADFPINRPGTAQDVSTCPARAAFYDTADSHAGKNTHYAANGAGASTLAASFNRNDGAIGDNANGVFVSMANVVASDGASTTLLIAERDSSGALGTGLDRTWMPWTWSGNTIDRIPSGVPLCGNFTTFDGNNAAYVVHPDGNGPTGALLFGLVAAGAPAAPDPAAAVISPSTRVINNGYPSRLPASGTNATTAAHPGGVFVAFVDGSTKFLKDDLPPHVYAHLLTHRSVWDGSSYSTNSARMRTYLNALPTTSPPTTNPYVLKPGDY